MITIKDKFNCCGCSACYQICPKRCIVLKEDEEGFVYPIVDESLCINCGLCEKACPVIHQSTKRKPLAIYAAKNRDEDIRQQSSSGGVFTLLAEAIIRQKGVVFGAQFNEQWSVVHRYAETIKGLAAFRGSKYVQSQTGDCFPQVQQFLKQGQKVLFSGTPCQVAGLKLFLKKEYTNLLTVDFICHGVPSPKVWRKYKAELLAQAAKNRVSKSETVFFTAINFRDKRTGWKKYSFATTVGFADQNTASLHTTFHENIYMRGFLRNLYLRPSCHACPSKSLKSGSDITIADFWGIQRLHPEFDDDKGANLVIINSKQGASEYSCLQLESIVTTQQALQSALFNSAKAHPKRDKFFQQLDSVASLDRLIQRLTHIPLRQSIFLKGKQIIKKILLKFSNDK